MRELDVILAAINMSSFDDEVMKRAVQIAKEADAQLHFTHAIDRSEERRVGKECRL